MSLNTKLSNKMAVGGVEVNREVS